MTFFMISGLVGFLVVVFLLWCFRGFSHDLKQGQTIGLLVRPVATQRAVLKQNIQRVVRMSVRKQGISSRNGAKVDAEASFTARLAGRS